ncbi:MAG: hypothetical protein RLY86_383, partial [Pseudomonadota bacterium]
MPNLTVTARRRALLGASVAALTVSALTLSS